MKASHDDLTLDLLADFGTPEAPSNPIEERFWTFHGDNPDVYSLFSRFADQLIRAGRTQFGVSLIIERMRWETAIRTSGGDEFKLNNNYRAYYARLWMRDHPQHGDFFRTRRTLAGEVSKMLRKAE